MPTQWTQPTTGPTFVRVNTTAQESQPSPERKMGAEMSDKAWRKGEMLNSHFSSARYFWYWFEGVSVAMPEVVGDAILAEHNLTDALSLEVNALSERLTLMTLDRDLWRSRAEHA